MASAAPPGTRIETLSITRRGDVSFRVAMRDAQQVSQFRSKLVESGAFSTIVIEEQTPTADRKKVNVRITGQWQPVAAQKSLPSSQREHTVIETSVPAMRATSTTNVAQSAREPNEAEPAPRPSVSGPKALNK